MVIKKKLNEHLSSLDGAADTLNGANSIIIFLKDDLNSNHSSIRWFALLLSIGDDLLARIGADSLQVTSKLYRD